MSKRAGALPGQRRAQIVQLIESRGSASIPELSASFQVSTDTIRRDLDALARSGTLARDHGGAMRLVDNDRSIPFDARAASATDAKTAIARAAAALVQDGETLIVNGGSTTLAVVKQLRDHAGTALITNSIAILDQLEPGHFASIHVMDGEYVAATKTIIGPVKSPFVDRITIDTAIIGVRALTLGKGIAVATLAEATMLSAMIEVARRTIVVADSSKFGKTAFATIAPLSAIDVLVTDTAPSPTFQDALLAAGVHLVVA